MYAHNVEEAVVQLNEALIQFEIDKDAWELLRSRCQQLSQWIEHGKGVTEEMKPHLCKMLYAAEKRLQLYQD